jgi:hypothetical protein
MSKMATCSRHARHSSPIWKDKNYFTTSSSSSSPPPPPLPTTHRTTTEIFKLTFTWEKEHFIHNKYYSNIQYFLIKGI